VGKKLPKVGIVIGSDSDLEVMREAENGSVYLPATV